MKRDKAPNFPVAPVLREVMGVDCPDVTYGHKMILCPWHGERHPSLSVREYGYKCFGCEESGDAISLLRKEEGLTFEAAVARAAEITGLTDQPAPRNGWSSGVLSFGERDQ